MRAAFYTLGCKVNQYETQILMDRFLSAGYLVVSPDEKADVYVVNSCTVTDTGDKKSRQILRRFRRQNPDAIIALTGCFPQAFPDSALALIEADVVTGSGNRQGMLDAIERYRMTGQRVVEITRHMKAEGFEPMKTEQFYERTRAFVKIEDGCESYCSYCIIPKARGFVRSKKISELLDEVQALAQNGYREVVLVGINLSCYGKELGLKLKDAVAAACSVEGIKRVRLGSIEPELLTEEDIAAMAKEKKLCGQFHLSLQSGCTETLARMRRQYTAQEYEQIVSYFRTYFPGCAITTDIMVGFPGETNAEFKASLAFAEKIAFAKTHVFIYSKRPGTAAAAMPEQVDPAIQTQRSHDMIALTNKTRDAFLSAQIGKTQTVLFEREISPGIWEGYTEQYTPVHIPSTAANKGNILPVRITGVTGETCLGELVD